MKAYNTDWTGSTHKLLGNIYKVSVGKNGGKFWETLAVNGKIILKLILKKCGLRYWTNVAPMGFISGNL